MLVHVKEPPTDLRVTGPGAEAFVADLRSRYPDLVIADEEDDEYVNIEDTDWYRERKAKMTLGKRLRIYRDNAELTLAVLAELSGIPKGNLSAMENDKRPIGSMTAKHLAKALNCDYRSLL